MTRDEANAPQTIALEFARTEQPEDPFAFQETPQVYTLRGEGGGVSAVRLGWDAALRADLAALARPGCDPAVAQRVGEALRGLLVPAGWERREELIGAAAQAGRPVRISVRSAAAELYALPWELMAVGASGRLLGELPSVLVQYTWPNSQTTPESPRPRPEGGRVVIAWSAAAGRVPAPEHVRAIAAAAEEGGHPFDAAADVVANVSLAALARVLADGRAAGRPVAVLHLLCHGGRRGASVGLWLDGDGEAALVDPGDLRRTLAPFADTLRLVLLSACSAGDPGELGNHLGSAAMAVHRAGIEAVVASRFPLSVSGSITITQTLYRALLVDLRSLEEAVQRARVELTHDPQSLDWAGLQLYARPEDGGDTRPVVIRPYRGLLAFLPQHQRLFFGRERKEAELVEALAGLRAAGRPRMLVVAGASGAGKSSVVLAGAAPRLLAEWRIELVRMHPGAAPLQTLAERLGPASSRRPCLLVVDQLEEIFTHVADRTEREGFMRALWRLAADPDGRVSVVATLRVDFIGACDEVILEHGGLRLDQIACDRDHAVMIAQMSGEDLRAAIERPALAVGLSFEPGLVQRILSDLGDAPGSLPLLAHTLDLVWRRRDGRTLTQAAYEAIGGVSGAVEGWAEELFSRLDPGEQGIARQTLVRMVAVGRDGSQARRRVRLDALRPTDPGLARGFDRVVEALIAARLTVLGEELGAATIEIAHDSLIRSWQRLAGWLREDADKLAALAELAEWVEPWKTHKALLSGDQLGYAVQLAARYADDLTPEMRALIAQSQAAAAKRARRRQVAFISSVVATVLLAGLAVALWWSAREARGARAEADQRARLAEAAEREAARAARRAREAMMLSAARLAKNDALAHGRLLRDIADPGLRGWLATAALLVDEGPPPRTVHAHLGAIRGVALSADGGAVASASDDRTVQVVGFDGSAPVVLEHPAIVLDVAMDAAGAVIASVDYDGAVRLWRRDAPRSPVPLRTPPVDPTRVAFDRSEQWVAAAGISGPVIWRADGSGRPIVFRCPAAPPALPVKIGLAWSPDGRRLAASCPGGIAVWEVARPGEPVPLPVGVDGVKDMNFRADGLALAIVDTAGVATHWGLEGRPRRLGLAAGAFAAGFSGDAPVVVDAARLDAIEKPAHALPSPDGAKMLALSASGSAAILSREGEVLLRLRAPPATMPGQQDGARLAAAWAADGRSLALAGRDHIVRVWSLRGHDPPVWLAGDDPVVGVAVHPREDRVLLRRRTTLAIHRLADGAPVGAVWRADAGLVDAVWSPDGARVAALTAAGEVVFWTAGADAAAPVAALGAGAGAPLQWSPDGAWLAARRDGEVLLWRPGAPPRALGCVEAVVRRSAFSRDGEALALGCSDGVVVVATTGKDARWVLPAADGPVTDLAWSPDGALLAVGYWDRIARVWRRDGAGEPKLLRGHTEPLTAVAWHRSGTLLVTASADNTGRLWQVDGVQLRSDSHDGDITTMVFNASGSGVMSAGADGTARVWSLTDEPIVLSGIGRVVTSAQWSHDGRRVVTLGDGGSARVHLVDGALMQQWLMRHVHGCMSVEQRGALLGETKDVSEIAYAMCRALYDAW